MSLPPRPPAPAGGATLDLQLSGSARPPSSSVAGPPAPPPTTRGTRTVSHASALTPDPILVRASTLGSSLGPLPPSPPIRAARASGPPPVPSSSTPSPSSSQQAAPPSGSSKSGPPRAGLAPPPSAAARRLKDRRKSSLKIVRPRSVSVTHVSLLAKLSKANVSWHVLDPLDPVFAFHVRALGEFTQGTSRPAMLLLTISSSEPPEDWVPRLDIVRGDAVVKTIELAHVVNFGAPKDSAGDQLDIIYKMDKGGTLKQFKISIIFGCKMARKNLQLLMFVYLRKNFKGFSTGLICLHKGYAKVTTDGIKGRRYLRLFDQRIVVYKTHQHDMPSRVFCLGTDSDTPPEIYRDPKKKNSITVKTTFPKGTEEFRIAPDTKEELTQWESALKCEQTFSQRFVDMFTVDSKEKPDDWMPSDGKTVEVGSLKPPPGAALGALSEVPEEGSGEVEGGGGGGGGGTSQRSSKPPTLKTSFDKAPSGDELVQMNTVQRMLFGYLAQFRPHAIIHSSNVPRYGAWIQNTPAGRLLSGSRGRLMKRIDAAVGETNRTLERNKKLLMRSRLLCIEVGATGAAAQIGFAFPGFDSQVFDVGKLAVLCPAQFFEGTSTMSFQDFEWNGALKSPCVAKELMQASPDVSQLFDDGKADEAKQIMLEAQRSVLHNIYLATYCNQQHLADPDPAKIRLADADSIPWSKVVSAITGAKNSQHTALYEGWTYMYNPSPTLMEMLCNQDTKVAESGSKKKLTVPSGGGDIDRILCSPLCFILLLRQLLESRESALNKLAVAIKDWQQKHPVRLKVNSVRFDEVCRLKDQTVLDFASLHDVLRMLPAKAILIRALDSTRTKRKAGKILGKFLTRRLSFAALQTRGILPGQKPGGAGLASFRKPMPMKLSEQKLARQPSDAKLNIHIEKPSSSTPATTATDRASTSGSVSAPPARPKVPPSPRRSVAVKDGPLGLLESTHLPLPAFSKELCQRFLDSATASKENQIPIDQAEAKFILEEIESGNFSLSLFNTAYNEAVTDVLPAMNSFLETKVCADIKARKDDDWLSLDYVLLDSDYRSALVRMCDAAVVPRVHLAVCVLTYQTRVLAYTVPKAPSLVVKRSASASQS